MEILKSFNLTDWITIGIVLAFFIFGVKLLSRSCRKCRWCERSYCNAGKGFLYSDRAIFCRSYEER